MCCDSVAKADLNAIERLARERPLSRIVVVTRLSPEAIDVLRTRPDILQRVVWVAAASRMLRPTVDELLTPHFLERAAARFIELVQPTPIVQWFLVRMWAHPSPPTTVKTAAKSIGIGWSTLKDHWSELATRAHLSDVVDWALLGRAVAYRINGASWTQAAYRLDISEARLSRVALRRLEVELDEIDGEGPAWIERRFATWFKWAFGNAPSP